MLKYIRYITQSINFYKSGNFSQSGNLSARKCTHKILSSTFLPQLMDLLYILSLLVPCTLTCASLPLPLFNHYTMISPFYQSKISPHQKHHFILLPRSTPSFFSEINPQFFWTIKSNLFNTWLKKSPIQNLLDVQDDLLSSLFYINKMVSQ